MEDLNDLKCLLCLNADPVLTKIYGDDGKRLNIATLLKLHFWFELKDDETESSDCICSSCWSHIENFHLFYMKISEIHNSSYWNDIKDEMLITAIKQESDSVIDDFLNQNCNSNVKLETQNEKNIKTFVVDEDKEEFKNDEGETMENSEAEEEKSENETTSDTDMRKDEDDYNEEADDDEDEDDEEYSENKSEKSKRKNNKKSKVNNKTKSEKKLDLKKIQEEDLLIRDFFKMNCELCPKVFDKFYQVRTHYRVEHDMQRGYLSCCNRKFFKRCHALEHAQRHIDPESFRCTICLKLFSSKKCLIGHIESHDTTLEKPYQCTKCPKAFAKKFQLYQHQIQHIPEQEKKFTCDECGKAFAKNSILQSHKRIVHAGAHVHVCEICAKSYKSKMFFERHYQMVHCNKIPPKLQCQLCGVWLKQDSLRKHMVCHEDEGKPHICNICGKHSPNSRALQSHIKFAHLAERTHKCSICDKAFKRALALKEHMTLHTGEVLYTCPHCPRTFNSGANMHSHRKKVHPKEWEENRRNKLSNIN